MKFIWHNTRLDPGGSRAILVKSLVILGRGLSTLVAIVVLSLSMLLMAAVTTWMLIVSDIPDIKQLDYVTTFNRTLKIFSREGYLIGEFGDRLRIPLKYNQIPKNLVYAFIVAEDEHFFEHSRSHGCKATIFSRLIYGCKSTIPFMLFQSTIPYRLAKNINYRNWEVGKIGRVKRYLLMAAFIFRMKQKLSKQRIMQIYLNRIYLGHRAVGVQAAANIYYGTTVDKLTLAQIAMIAGLPRAPSLYNPINRPKRAKTRRNYVLRRMYDLNYISEKQYDNGVRSEITAKIHHKNVNKFEAGYVAEMSRLYMDKKFGHTAYRNGYSVYTSISVKHQKWANNALRLALLKYDRRHGFRGAEDKKLIKTNITEKQKRKIIEKYTVIGGLIPGLVTEVHDKSVNVYLLGGKNITLNWKAIKWARKYISPYQKGRRPTEAKQILSVGNIVRVESEKNSNWRLAQIPKVSGAMVSLSPYDGSILAIVGGFDFYQVKFNRVTQAKRQIGSNIFTFIFSAGIKKGFTPDNIITRKAPARSWSLVATRIIKKIGVEYTINHAMLFGFGRAQFTPKLSFLLDRSEVTPLQMATAYAVFANGGFKVEPYYITKITEYGKGTIYEVEPYTVCLKCRKNRSPKGLGYAAPRVVSGKNAYQITSMLKRVIRERIAKKVLKLKRNDIAGKAATSHDKSDSWFTGYNDKIVSTVWIGFDDSKSLEREEYEGVAALTAWISYMLPALKDMP